MVQCTHPLTLHTVTCMCARPRTACACVCACVLHVHVHGLARSPSPQRQTPPTLTPTITLVHVSPWADWLHRLRLFHLRPPPLLQGGHRRWGVLPGRTRRCEGRQAKRTRPRRRIDRWILSSRSPPLNPCPRLCPYGLQAGGRGGAGGSVVYPMGSDVEQRPAGRSVDTLL